jgi:hypothetical protein
VLAHTPRAFLVLSIFYVSSALIPSLIRVLLKSSRNARICARVAPSARAASIFQPTTDATRGLRFKKAAIQCLPTGVWSLFIRRIRFAISRARACEGGNARASSSSIHCTRKVSCSGVNLCWYTWLSRLFCLPCRRVEIVDCGMLYALAAAR